MNGALQVSGFALSLLAFVLSCVAIFLPEWRVNDPRGEIVEAIFLHQGLWARCVGQATGQWQCDDWDAKFLGLSTQLQVGRSLAIFSIFFGFGALALSVIGLECSACLQDNKDMKSKMSKIAAGLWVASAFCIGIAVSYYANQIATAFSISNFQTAQIGDRPQVWVFGTSIFLGWAALILGFVGGLVMWCGSYVDDDDDTDDYMSRRVGRGVRRMRESFRESYRALRPGRRPADKEVDYV